jgi:osmotically-inducible protein OsmY
MTATTLEETDVRLRDAVVRELDWDPEVDASAIGVAARDGVVTLTGYVDTYPGKLAAERTAQRVQGVRAVGSDIEVRLKPKRTDVDIAKDASRALRLLNMVPGGVQAIVHDGYVTLTGEVEWLFQKLDAENAARHVEGVHGVLNHIQIAPRAARA